MKKKVGEILVEKGWATPDQIEKALAYGKAENCRIGEALLNLELCSQEQITRALAIHNQLPFANLGKHVIAQDIIDASRVAGVVFWRPLWRSTAKYGLLGRKQPC